MIEVTRVSDQLGPLPNHRNDELPRCASDIPVQVSKKMNTLNQRKARASGLTESRRSAISKLLATSRLGTFQGDLLLLAFRRTRGTRALVDPTRGRSYPRGSSRPRRDVGGQVSGRQKPLFERRRDLRARIRRITDSAVKNLRAADSPIVQPPHRCKNDAGAGAGARHTKLREA